MTTTMRHDGGDGRHDDSDGWNDDAATQLKSAAVILGKKGHRRLAEFSLFC
jgi:hypothetical protein